MAPITLKTTDAVILLDRIRIMVAKEKDDERETPFLDELEALLDKSGIDVPEPCGVKHVRGVKCPACLQSPRGVNWGWAGKQIEIR